MRTTRRAGPAGPPGANRRFHRGAARLPLQKAPGLAESLDWALALMSLHSEHLDAATLEQTLGCVIKVHEDRGVMRAHQAALDPILGDVPANLRSGGYSLDTDFGFGSVSSPRR